MRQCGRAGAFRLSPAGARRRGALLKIAWRAGDRPPPLKGTPILYEAVCLRCLEKSPEAREFTTASCEAWEVASIAGGIPEADAKSMAANTKAFYVPPLEEPAS